MTILLRWSSRPNVGRGHIETISLNENKDNLESGGLDTPFASAQGYSTTDRNNYKENFLWH